MVCLLLLGSPGNGNLTRKDLSMFRTMLISTVLATLTLVGNADAGVRGGAFVGDLSNGQSPSLHFAQTGNGFFTKSINGDSTGTYTELDLIVVSFWNASITQPNATTISGVGFLGLTTTVRTEDASGLYFRGTVINIRK
jgi:hypothetical protein